MTMILDLERRSVLRAFGDDDDGDDDDDDDGDDHDYVYHMTLSHISMGIYDSFVSDTS